jgi:hypothetical protein
MRAIALLPVTALMLAGLSVGSVHAEASATAIGFRRAGETQHGRYFVSGSAKNASAEGGVDVRRTEAYLERLASLFGPLPRDWHFEYYRHASAAAISTRLGFAAVGVTDLDRARIDSIYAFHPHELVHVVAGRLGRAPTLFSEGLAVALTSAGVRNGSEIDAAARARLDSHRGWRELLEDPTAWDDASAYAVAGSFVAFLLDGWGIQPMIAFLGGCEDGTPQRSADAFRRAYGRTIPDLAFEWEKTLRQGRMAQTREWYDERTWPASLQRVIPEAPRARRAQAGERAAVGVVALSTNALLGDGNATAGGAGARALQSAP